MFIVQQMFSPVMTTELYIESSLVMTELVIVVDGKTAWN